MDTPNESQPSGAASSPPTREMVSTGQLDVDEIDLSILINFLIRNWWVIAIGALTFAVGGYFITFTMDRVYRSEVIMAPNMNTGGSGLPGLPGQLSGFAGLVGVDPTPKTGSTDVAIAILKSRSFTEDFIRDYEILPVLFPDEWNATAQEWRVNPPSNQAAYEFFNEKVRTVAQDRNTGLVSLAIEWKDPELVAVWANALVERLNASMQADAVEEAERNIEYLNRALTETNVVGVKQSIYGLIESQIENMMIASGQSEFAFRVIDPASPQDESKTVAPRRILIAGIAGVLGLLLAVVVSVRRDCRKVSIKAS